MKRYPDVSELLMLKEARRKRLAQLSVEEKMQITHRLREASQVVSKSVSGGKRSTKTHAAKAGNRW